MRVVIFKPTLLGAVEEKPRSIKPGLYSLLAGVVLVGGLLYAIKNV